MPSQQDPLNSGAGSPGSDCGAVPQRAAWGRQGKGGASYFPAHRLFLTTPALQRPVKIFGSWRGCPGHVNELQEQAFTPTSSSSLLADPAFGGDRDKGLCVPPGRPLPGCWPGLTPRFSHSGTQFPPRRGKGMIPAWEQEQLRSRGAAQAPAAPPPPLNPHRGGSAGLPSSSPGGKRWHHTGVNRKERCREAG